MNRRSFLTSTATSVLLGAHLPGTFWQTELKAPLAGDNPRILSLKLKTAASLDEMRDFYENILELEILFRNTNELCIRAGMSTITFEKINTHQEPFYHFAFNIPENKIRNAHHWQKERTPLLTLGGNLRDPDYPNDVIHFAHWNAHSLFFLDPAGNVLEHIARHDLNNATDGEFTSSDIKYISEIAYVVNDVRKQAKMLSGELNLLPYRGSSNVFTALGDEEGLVILMRKGRELGGGQKAGIFPVQSTIYGLDNNTVQIPGHNQFINVVSHR